MGEKDSTERSEENIPEGKEEYGAWMVVQRTGKERSSRREGLRYVQKASYFRPKGEQQKEGKGIRSTRNPDSVCLKIGMKKGMGQRFRALGGVNRRRLTGIRREVLSK